MNDRGSSTQTVAGGSAKHVPAGAIQHATAGPYSPVLEVQADRFIVISGQVALDLDGNVVGDTIEDQSRQTLANCRRLLESAGCTFHDVFKVNAFMTDLNDWNRFNVVYMEIMPEPRPVRTTVGVKLLGKCLIEIEMWAAKRK
jgi:2-iminobutanoate/2-iminopropanoate deaminase